MGELAVPALVCHQEKPLVLLPLRLEMSAA
jgi:hypothetical protein